MATADENLDAKIVARLAELGMTKPDLYHALRKPDGTPYKQAYQTYWDLFQAPLEERREFTPFMQAQIAKILRWPPDVFESYEVARQRAEHVKREFAEFVRAANGEFDQATLDTLESMVWRGDKWPTVKLFKLLAMILSGDYGLSQIAEAIQSEADARDDDEPPRTPRRR